MVQKIYMFDNHTGKNLPSKIGAIIPDILLFASSIGELHKAITKDSKMFCVVTPLKDADFVVPTEGDKKILDEILAFGNYDCTVIVEPSSSWYTIKVWKNIIVSGDIPLDTNQFATLLNMYLEACADYEKREDAKKRVIIFTIVNTRSGKEIYKTPSLDEAIRKCNNNPCHVVKDKDGNIVYTSKFGKVAPNISQGTHLKKHKAKLTEMNTKGLSFKNR